MNFSAPFIRRPVATTLVMVAMLMFGVMAYVRLPVSALPNVDFPTITVSASLPGASGETMASSVVTPLERELSTIDGLESMTSSSSLSNASITLQFDITRDLDSVAQDVQAAIARAGSRLPRDMPAPPNYRKVNPADQPILHLGLSSATLPLSVVNEYAETRLAQAISAVRGVAQVQVSGAQKYAVRLQIDADKLAALNIGLNQVAEAVRSSNVNLPTGVLHGPNKAFTISADGQLENAAAYGSVVVDYQNGAPVRVSDLGRAIDGVENDKTAAWLGNREGMQRSITLSVQKQPGANTIEVAERVRALLPQFLAEAPASIDLKVQFDRSISIQRSVRDVEFTLLVTLGLVVLVIFAFLRRLRATLIPSLSMPLSILGTFAVMYLLGYTVNNLTLMALTLSVGFVVDDAIVMLENIVRHTEAGKRPLEAAYAASKEIGFTILSMTVSLVAVFVPFLFMGGILGLLFKEFAVTIAVAILVSGFISLTLTPMLTARMLRVRHPGSQSGFYRATERGFEAVLAAYASTLRRVLAYKKLTLLFSLAILVATVVLYQRIPQGFLPTEDNDQIFATTEALEGISFDALKERQVKVADIVRKNPNVESVMSSVGSRGGMGGANQGILFLRLKPLRERTKSASEVIQELQPELQDVPGMRVFMQVPPPIRLGGRLTKSEYQLSLQGTDLRELYRYVPLLVEELSKSPVLVDVTTDLLLKNPELKLHIDRDRAAALGVTVQEIEDTLYSAYGTRQISTILAANNSYQVILELDPRTQTDLAALQALYVRSRAGALVPLAAVAKVEPSLGPLTVNHVNQLPAVSVSFNVAPGHGLSEGVGAAESAARRILPPTVTARFQGSAAAFQSSIEGLTLLLLVATFVIYIVLGILYESYIHPLTILSALPFAGFGALATLTLWGMDLNVYAFVGVILLIGLVKKNGIMMVDFAIQAGRDPNVGAEEAILRACVARFRPIMMTTMAALLGTLPIALGVGAGAESRQPLGLAVVGGLLFSQIVTLYVTPVFYVLFDGMRRKRKGGESSGQTREGSGPVTRVLAA